MENKNEFMGMTDIGQAEKILNQFRRDYPDDSKGAVDLLDKLLEALYVAKPLVGDADDFHNFSVSVSKLIDDNKIATDIVKRGLNIHPNNTDLLADAIKYGYSCGEKEECSKWFARLNMIDKSRWTWRAFSFSIDYLLDEWTSDNANEYKTEDIYNLVKEYQKMIPDNEDSYLTEYEFYAGTNQKETGINALEIALSKFKNCPRCWLKYADIMIEDGEFEKAEPIIKKLIRNPKSVENVNMAYVYFLDAQCKIYDLRGTEDYDNGIVDEKVVLSIYRTLRKALSASGLRETIKNQIEGYIIELEADSGLDYPDDWR